jgi:glutamate N-acetyltransferase/amino-acid N-acetyltransferase
VSITAPEGFTAAGMAAGIKASGALDLALVATADGEPVPTAATFTSNLAAAAPVQVSRDHLRATGGRAAGIVVSSGNANAATGARGRADALRMCALTATGIGVRTDQVLVCSTGLIGIPLPMGPVEDGIPALVAARSGSARSAEEAATGILTTDSGRKEVLIEHRTFSVAGMAKGAGMLAPDMATMRESFNSMTVDGCTSTNDTVILMASGRAGLADPNVLVDVVTEACSTLAGQMLADAEGASKIFQVRVTGARSDGEAHRAARKVADSLLVKCSLNGGDPYWGRVASDLGSAGIDFDMDRLDIAYGGVTVCHDGTAANHDRAAVAAHLSGAMVDIHCRLGLADGDGVVMGVDLGPGYIDENRTTS